MYLSIPISFTSRKQEKDQVSTKAVECLHRDVNKDSQNVFRLSVKKKLEKKKQLARPHFSLKKLLTFTQQPTFLFDERNNEPIEAVIVHKTMLPACFLSCEPPSLPEEGGSRRKHSGSYPE